MTEHERLVDLLDEAFLECDDNYGRPNTEQVAEHLLNNGVIAPPCKVGDTVYSIVDGITQVFEGRVYAIEITEFGTVYRFTRKGYYTGGCTEEAIGKTVFLTREEAEAALKERSKG